MKKYDYDPSNPLDVQQQHEEDDENLAKKYLDLQNDFIVHSDYHKQQNVAVIRSLAIPSIYKYARDQHDAFVPYLAISFVDSFLSTNIDIPVILPGKGLERNVELFAFCCVSIAFKTRSSDFSVLKLLSKHQVADVKDVMAMELQILEGLNNRVRPVTAITFLYFLLPGLKTKVNPQGSFPNIPSSRLLFDIQTDIRFTRFRPSTLAATAILVGSHEIFPVSHSKFLKKIFASKFALQWEVEECFDELKTYVVTHERMPNHEKYPRVTEFDETYRWYGVREEGKVEIAQQMRAISEKRKLKIAQEMKANCKTEPEEAPCDRSTRKEDVHNLVKCASYKGFWDKGNRSDDTEEMEGKGVDPILVQTVKGLEVI